MPAGDTYEVEVLARDERMYASRSAYATSATVPAPVIPPTVPTGDDDLEGPSGPIEKVVVGAKVVLEGSGFAAFSTVRILAYSTPTELGTAVTDGNGDFVATVTIPAGLAPGQHSLVVTGIDANGAQRTLRVDVTVSASGATSVAAVTSAAPATTAAARLASTGFSVAGPLLGGTAALGPGAGLIVASRRSRAG